MRILTTQRIVERSKDYKLLLLGQILTLINYLVVYPVIERTGLKAADQLFVLMTGLLSLVMNIFGYLLLRDLTESRFIRRTVIVMLSAGILLGVLSTLLLPPKIEVPVYLAIITSGCSCVLVSFSILLALMIYDIFNEKHDIAYRLWGAASIYFLIGVLFGTLYFIADVIFPGDFGFDTLADHSHFVKCFTYSFYTLSGIDNPFEDISLLIKNISVIQSLFANLYIILLVGRLLSK